MKTRITKIFSIRYPIICGGMVWCSGHRLATAVSKAGGLGLIGAGSMHPDTLREHIVKCREELAALNLPFGVNIPLFYPELEKIIDIVIQERVPIVFTSGGSPALYTERLHAAGIKVAHVVASAKFALKAQAAGVDVVVAEGTEAGGHNGRDETTTMILTPLVAQAVKIPVITAGGVGTGAQMAAAFALGAEAVQIGSRFALCEESSAHDAFKDRCRDLAEGDTILTLKALTPARLVRNEFCNQVEQLQTAGASKEEMAALLGKGRAKRGIFEGDLIEGELEIGQVASLIKTKETAAEIVAQIINDYKRCRLLIVNSD